MLFAYLRYFLLCRAVSSIALGMLRLNDGVGRGGGLCGLVSRGGSRNLNKPNVMINNRVRELQSRTILGIHIRFYLLRFCRRSLETEAHSYPPQRDIALQKIKTPCWKHSGIWHLRSCLQ